MQLCGVTASPTEEGKTMIYGLRRVPLRMVGTEWVVDKEVHEPSGYLHIYQTQVMVSGSEAINFVTSAQDIQLGLGRMSPVTQRSLAMLVVAQMATCESRMLTLCYWGREILVTQVGECSEGDLILHLSPVKVSPGQGGGH